MLIGFIATARVSTGFRIGSSNDFIFTRLESGVPSERSTITFSREPRCLCQRCFIGFTIPSVIGRSRLIQLYRF